MVLRRPRSSALAETMRTCRLDVRASRISECLPPGRHDEAYDTWDDLLDYCGGLRIRWVVLCSGLPDIAVRPWKAFGRGVPLFS
jgi:hypothetical protein